MMRKTATSRFRPPATAVRRRKRQAAFTLLELLALMLILAIIAALWAGITRPPTDIYARETKYNMQIIMAAINEYHRASGKYPPTAGWVSELASAAESRKFIAKLGENVWNTTNTNEFHDAWGNAIAYSPTGGLAGGPGLVSAGPDGDHGTEEDNVRHNK